MTLKPEVLAAMDKVERNAMLGGYWPITELEWQTIRAELLAMDAEIERLTKENNCLCENSKSRCIYK
jgi:hypothetical protein